MQISIDLQTVKANVGASNAPELPYNQYTPYAVKLIEDHLNDKGQLDDNGIEAIRTIKDNHASGTLTKHGYRVKVKCLMGAFNSINSQLADALASTRNESTKTESEFF